MMSRSVDISRFESHVRAFLKKYGGGRLETQYRAKVEIFNPILQPDLIKWAKIEESTESELHPVTIKTFRCYNPWEFIGVNSKSLKELASLNNDLSSWVEHQSRNDYLEYWNQLEVGSIVAAKEPETKRKWVRAMITCVWNFIDETSYSVFIVDTGIPLLLCKKEEIFPIPTKFVTELPFQAIAFSLSHIQPKDKTATWKVHEIMEIFDLMIPDGIDLAVTRKVDRLWDGMPTTATTCNYYSAVVIIEDKEIGMNLVEKGVANEVYSVSSLVGALKNAMKNAPVESASVTDNVSSPSTDNERDNNCYKANQFREIFAMKKFLEVTVGDQEMDKMEMSEFADCTSFDFTVELITKLFPNISLEVEREHCNDGSNAQGAAAAGVHDDDPSYNAAANVTFEENQERFVVDSPPVPPVPRTTSSFTTGALPNAKESVWLHPTIYWHQTVTDVILTIQLPDIKEYKIDIGSDDRTIRCRIIQPKNYGFHLTLFNKVAEYTAFLNRQQLKLVFEKLTIPNTWTRLLYDKNMECPSWIKINPDSPDEDDISIIYPGYMDEP